MTPEQARSRDQSQNQNQKSGTRMSPADSDRITCDFCAFQCRLADGEEGRCGVRLRRGGEIISRYPMEFIPPRSEAVEKKPLYHFYPGSRCLSLGAFGCNFRCSFCQNYQLVHREYRHPGQYRAYSPEEITSLWEDAGKIPVAFTYSEPAVWQDSMFAVSREVNARGASCIMVSNGFYSYDACSRLMEQISAFNIDLKGPGDFYPRYCRGGLKPVMENIRRIARSPDHVLEVTTLVIQDLHSRDEIVEIGKQLEDGGVKVWHLSLFHPAYKMSHIPPTSPDFVTDIIDEFRQRGVIPHIYLGNARVEGYGNTRCSSCGAELIHRDGYRIRSRVRTRKNQQKTGRRHSHTDPGGSAFCPDCGTALYGRYD
ncbi:radical SAM protein [Salinispira pacifica]|uniref:Putative pyruvate-formate lyase-activating enzyme n=1 Tax=Salinispira pacifica TaxID=1307761 RepID=V5WKE8_9SPIO|nr:radical SAM protein [Salinispira pacifica]AHC16228.1 Putative pyruvate-formate lyase-activating enzyme [Salinispira pacifica]